MHDIELRFLLICQVIAPGILTYSAHELAVGENSVRGIEFPVEFSWFQAIPKYLYSSNIILGGAALVGGLKRLHVISQVFALGLLEVGKLPCRVEEAEFYGVLSSEYFDQLLIVVDRLWLQLVES